MTYFLKGFSTMYNKFSQRRTLCKPENCLMRNAFNVLVIPKHMTSIHAFLRRNLPNTESEIFLWSQQIEDFA